MEQALQIGTPTGLARAGPRPPYHGMVAGTDRRPTGAGKRCRADQPRANLSLRLSSRGAEGLLQPLVGHAQGPTRPPRAWRCVAAEVDQTARQPASQAARSGGSTPTGPLGGRPHAVRQIRPGSAGLARAPFPCLGGQTATLESRASPSSTPSMLCSAPCRASCGGP